MGFGGHVSTAVPLLEGTSTHCELLLPLALTDTPTSQTWKLRKSPPLPTSRPVSRVSDSFVHVVIQHGDRP